MRLAAPHDTCAETFEERSTSCQQMIVDNLSWINRLHGNTGADTASEPCMFGDILEAIPPDSFQDSDPFHRKLFDIDSASLCRRATTRRSSRVDKIPQKEL